MRVFFGLLGFGAMCALIAGYVTHAYVAVMAFAHTSPGLGYTLFLIFGLAFPPVGMVHGVGTWFGAW